MKKIVLKYVKNQKPIKYNNLVKIFGLPIEEISIIFNLYVAGKTDNGNYFLVNNKGQNIYKFEYGREFWVEYDKLDNVIHNVSDTGDWEKYFYDENNNFIGTENKYHKKTWSYDSNGEVINEKIIQK